MAQLIWQINGGRLSPNPERANDTRAHCSAAELLMPLQRTVAKSASAVSNTEVAHAFGWGRSRVMADRRPLHWVP